MRPVLTIPLSSLARQLGGAELMIQIKEHAHMLRRIPLRLLRGKQGMWPARCSRRDGTTRTASTYMPPSRSHSQPHFSGAFLFWVPAAGRSITDAETPALTFS